MPRGGGGERERAGTGQRGRHFVSASAEGSVGEFRVFLRGVSEKLLVWGFFCQTRAGKKLLALKPLGIAVWAVMKVYWPGFRIAPLVFLNKWH